MGISEPSGTYMYLNPSNQKRGGGGGWLRVTLILFSSTAFLWQGRYSYDGELK